MQHGVRFSGDGDLFATCSADQTIKLWEPRRGTLVSTLQGALGSVLDVRFASDASFVIAAGADGALRMVCWAMMWKFLSNEACQYAEPVLLDQIPPGDTNGGLSQGGAKYLLVHDYYAP